jgi:hypothetical protein
VPAECPSPATHILLLLVLLGGPQGGGCPHSPHCQLAHSSGSTWQYAQSGILILLQPQTPHPNT